jgi:hypothetical protein
MNNQRRAEEYEAKLVIHPDEPVFNDDGVDLLQIREFLDMTPLERLRSVENLARMVAKAKVVRG